MRHPAIVICLAVTGAMLLGLDLLHGVTGFGSAAFDEAFALWFHPVVFLGSGLSTLAAAAVARGERLAWSLVGGGLIFYGLGSVAYNLWLADDASASFPSVADGLWLALYPMTFAGLALLTHSRVGRMSPTARLDGLIGATVVASLVAALLFEPVLDVTVAGGAASVARLAYPLFDLGGLGFAIVAWSALGRRVDRSWIRLGVGFALLAVGDSSYVVAAAADGWAPGGWSDVPYAVGTMTIAAAAWAKPGRVTAGPRGEAGAHGVVLPFLSALAALALVAYAMATPINLLATCLVLATLLAVVVRFGLSLSRLKRQSTDLEALAATDALTGLAHHRTLHERLAEEVERAHRTDGVVSVVALDVDHFKAINDRHGHAQGDEVLVRVAAVLRQRLRPYDLAARVGGDEFVLLLPDSDGEAAVAAAERCRLALRAIVVGGTPLACSAGIATHRGADADAGDHLLEMADAALYAAKRAGRGRIERFEPGRHVLISDAAQYAEIRDLLADPDALTAHFQPIVEVATGRIAGYEALARFPGTSPMRPPDQWFAQARRCGLANALEARAIEVALAVADRPAGTFLSVNVSPAALLSPEVAAVLPDDLGGLIVELTEVELFSEDETLDLRIADLRARGARIALDDAGAGYAGLRELIRIKPDILKLDRALIRDIHRDGAKIALLEALAGFAVTTGAAVCAEGIEEADELRTLSRLNVTYAQGYALGRPAAPWPGVDAGVTRVAALHETAGMRLAVAPLDAAVTLGDVSSALAQISSLADLDTAMAMLERVMHADDAAISRVLVEEQSVQTMSRHDWGPTTKTYPLADYPTTRHVLHEQVIGQVVAGDPIADPAEVQLLEHGGFGATLLAPIVLRGVSVGLLELYRHDARPWTGLEIDQIRLLSNQLGAALLAVAPTSLAPIAR